MNPKKPTDAELDNRFRYQSPDAIAKEKHIAVTEKTLALAKELRDICPAGRNFSIALTALEEVRMRANAAIATERDWPQATEVSVTSGPGKPQPVIDRLKVELQELQTKAGLLASFIQKGAPGVVTEEERGLLRDQLAVQQHYITILQRRLELP